MKQGSNNRRPRSRGNGKRHSVRGQNFESNGPNVKVRGTAQQVLEKYLALARDASSSGDRIMAEAYFQHAEHYYRILNADGEQRNNNRNNNNRNRQQQAQETPEPEAAAAAAEPETANDAAAVEPAAVEGAAEVETVAAAAETADNVEPLPVKDPQVAQA